MKVFLLQLDLVNRGARRTFLFAHLGIFTLCTLFGLAYVLSTNLVGFVRSNLLGRLPQQELLVEVKKVDMAMFRVTAPDAPALSEQALIDFARIDGVSEVYPIRYATRPVSIEGSVFGRQFGSDIVLQGFEPDWLDPDLSQKVQWTPKQPIPVVLNQQLLVIYNNGFAKSASLPELSASAIINRTFDIHIGMGADRQVMQARVVGFSNKVGLGVCIPNDALLALHSHENRQPAPAEAAVVIQSMHAIPAVKRAISEMGFHIVEPPPVVQAFVRAGRILLFAGWGVVIVLIAVAVSYLNQTVKMLFYLKRHDYAMCRAMGMARSRLRVLLMTEMLIWVALDAIFGFVLASIGADLVNDVFLNDLLTKVTGLTMVITTPFGRLISMGLVLVAMSAIFLFPRVMSESRRHVGAALKGN